MLSRVPIYELIWLKHVLWIPDEMICDNYNDIKPDDTEALCILLGPFCYLSQFVDLYTWIFQTSTTTVYDF